ncbi:MAG: hypothetical protein ACO1NZ_14000 [Adhaeribacter sp.]
MKSLAVLFFGMFLWTQPSFARHADVTFFAGRGERFQLVLDGRLVNRYVTDQLHLPAVSAGYHVAEIRLPGRFGALVHRTRIFVEPGFRTDYLVQVAGVRPQVVVSKVRQYPLPIVGRPVPAPYRPYPSHPGSYSNPYRDRDHYDKDRYYRRDRDDHDRRDNDRYDKDRRDNDHRDNDRYDNDRRDDDRYDKDRRDSDGDDHDRGHGNDRDDRGRDDNSSHGRDRGSYGRQLTSGTGYTNPSAAAGYYGAANR